MRHHGDLPDLTLGSDLSARDIVGRVAGPLQLGDRAGIRRMAVHINHTRPGGFSSLTGASTTDYPSKTFDLIDDASWATGTTSSNSGSKRAGCC